MCKCRWSFPAASHTASELFTPTGSTIILPSLEQISAKEAVHTTLFWGNQLCDLVQAECVGIVLRADALGQRKKKENLS